VNRKACLGTGSRDIDNMNDLPPPTADSGSAGETPAAAPGKKLSEAARRALQEAAARRSAIDARAAEIAKSKEHQGRGGLDPVRYEDWEVKGLASDF
jgi:hypothetical protein